MADLPSCPYWQPALGLMDQFCTDLDDLAQSIRIIMTTPPGSVPLQPDFGVDLLPYMDAPQFTATPQLVRAVTQAIQRWETRVVVQGVQVDMRTPGQSTLTVVWIPSDQPDATAQSTTVTVANTVTGATTTLDGSVVGAPGGVAPLNQLGQIPAQYLPSNLQAGAGASNGSTSDVVDGGEIV